MHYSTKSMILLTVILLDMLAGVEVDIFVPSFPELKTQFNLSPFWLEALLSANFIGYCFSLIFVGNLADQFGRKKIIVLGLIIFICGSILCVMTTSYKLLLIGRFLQGIGISSPATLSFLIIADLYEIKKQQFLLAILNGVMNISVALAPVVGSYITIYFHWQGNFITLLLLAIISLAVTLVFIPNHKGSENPEQLSFRNYLPIFVSKPLMLAIINEVFLFTPYWVFLGMSSVLYIGDLGVSLKDYGYYQGSWALTFALGNIILGIIISRLNSYKMLRFSSYFCTISLIIIMAITFLNCTDPLIIALGFLPFSIATIIPTTIIYPICLNFIPQAKGKVSAIMQGGRLILTSISIEIAGYFYQGSFRNIGIIITSIILVALVTLYLIIKNQELMLFNKHNE